MSAISNAIAWIKGKSAGETLLAKALVDFAEGDSKDALADLLQGMIDLADGTEAQPPLLQLQTRMAYYGFIPSALPAAIPVTQTTPAASSTTPQGMK